MKIRCIYDELVPVGQLKPHPKNRNKHPQDQVNRLAKLIKYQGMRSAIVVSSLSGYMVKGHGTLLSFVKAGGEEAPVVYQDFDDAAQEYAFLQSDNAIAEWATLDLSGINTDLGDFGPDMDVDLLGIKGFEIDVADRKKGSDSIPAVPKNPKTKPGQLFQLGRHRLLCGDSTLTADVKTLFAGQQPDMVFTSPPYNVGIDYGAHDDKMAAVEYWKMILDILKNIHAFTSENCWILWNVGASVDAGFDRHMAMIREAGFGIDRAISWKKKGITGPPIFAHTQKKAKTKYYMPFFGWEFIFTCFKNKGVGSKPISTSLMDRRMTDVWEVDQSINSSQQAGHPAAFPVQLAADGIALFCDEIVYEPFCGSGTTLIAAEMMGRTCFGMEKDPAYCDVIISRWEHYSGEVATSLEVGSSHVLRKAQA